jgi:hypothetical protein
MNIYRTEFFSVCPENGVRIRYALEIQTNQMIKVEDLIDEVTLHHRGYHEDIADQLFRVFGGEQKLVAEHHGVTIESIRP